MKKLIHTCLEGMKTKMIIAVALLFLTSKISKAQLITIPDPAFITYLQSNFPSAMSGNQLDTTNISVTSSTSIDVNGLGISNLYGIQFFDMLISLDCSNNFLTSIPPLSQNLEQLICSNNQLSSLPPFYQGFKTLYCAQNNIGFLPLLPASVETIHCQENNMVSMASPLPDSLSVFLCDSNQLSALPALPVKLSYLICANNNITSLPQLPNGLYHLNCLNNQLSCLPQLPNSLPALLAAGNFVTCLPNIPTYPGFFADIGNAICNSAQIQSIINVSCGTLCTGSVSVTGTSGVALDYVFTNGYSSLGNNTGTATASNLCAGNYSVTIQPTGGGGCLSQLNFFVDSSLTLNVVTTNISCFGANDGQLCAVPSGGTIPYTYLWSNAMNTSCIPNLTAGIYTVTVYDINGCSATNTATVTQPAPLIISPEADQSICDGTTFNYCPFITGGVSPYAYLLEINGAPYPGFVPCITPINITSSSIFSLTVMDANGCIATDVFNITVNPTPTLGIQFNVNSCNGNPVQLCVPPVSSGTPPYIYQWGTGATTQCITSGLVGVYPYTVTDINGCAVSSSITYSYSPGWTAKELTNITLPTCGNCDGVGTVLVSGGNPIATYTWIPSGNTTATFNSICDNTDYAVALLDTSGCQDTLFFSLSCHSVWPGDANYDGTANNVDLLAIGIGYGTMDVIRPNATISWQAEIGIDWADTLAGGLNYKHIDCNGDGIIADDDTIAIQQNYGLNHPLRLLSPTQNPNDPYLYFDIVVDTIGTNQHVDVPIYFGASTQPADSIYGLAFTVNYDTALVHADSIGITFSPSWIGTIGTEMITLSHNDAINGQLHVGMTRITHTDTSGYGEIARIGIVTTDNVSGKLSSPVFDTLTFSISDVTIINKDELLRGFNLGADSIIVEDTTTGLTPTLSEGEGVTVYPNPTRNEFKVSGIKFKPGDEIVLTSVLGKEIYKNKIAHSTSNIKLQTSNLKNGVYFITIKTNNGNVVRKITVLH